MADLAAVEDISPQAANRSLASETRAGRHLLVSAVAAAALAEQAHRAHQVALAEQVKPSQSRVHPLPMRQAAPAQQTPPGQPTEETVVGAGPAATAATAVPASS